MPKVTKPPTNKTAELHRASQQLPVDKWIADICATLSLKPNITELTTLAAIGVGMSAWERDSLLKIIQNNVKGRK